MPRKPHWLVGSLFDQPDGAEIVAEVWRSAIPTMKSRELADEAEWLLSGIIAHKKTSPLLSLARVAGLRVIRDALAELKTRSV